MPNFTTKYVNKVPLVDTECPACKTGFLKMGKFGNPLCLTCKSAFKESKYPEKTSPDAQKGALDPSIVDKGGILLDEIANVNKRLDKLIAYLVKKLG